MMPLLSDIRQSPLLWLLAVVPVLLAVELLRPGAHTLLFILSIVAIVPLAALLGRATESVAARIGDAMGGLLNATLGNLTELLIALTALRAGAHLAAYPGIAIVLFLVNSRWTVGSWFVSSGFFIAENVEALGHPLVAWDQLREGLYRLSGTALVWSGYAGAILMVFAYVRSPAKAPLALVLAPIAAAALPLSAYIQGHPFRIRYDVPLVAACAALAGAGIGLLWSRIQPIAAALVVGAALIQGPPLSRDAPLILESQRDAVSRKGRDAVTAYLVQHRDRRTIMMSMGSLGHYMHDLSAHGFAIEDFLHEGNGDIWSFAMTDPKAVVGWMAIEEKAEGGDALYLEAKRHPAFLDGFIRVAEGGGVALYRR